MAGWKQNYSWMNKPTASEDAASYRAAMGGYDPAGAFRRITESPERREPSAVPRERMLSLAYRLYDTSGLAKRFVRDTKNFCLGEGVSFTVKNDPDDAARQVLTDFWTDPVNRLDLRLEKRLEFLFLLGEQCWPAGVNPATGRVRLSYIDPANIREVTTVSRFPEIPDHVLVAGGLTEAEKKLSVIKAKEATDRAPVRLSGDCFFFSINNPPNDPRGRSDLIHLFDFINGFEEGLYDELDRLKLIKSFIWDVRLEGADDAEIRRFLSENKTPRAGSVRVHNERVSWEAVAPDLKMADNRSFFDLMKTYLAACMNRPDSWLGSGGKAYQTEAELMGVPTFKDLASRRRYVKHMLEYVLTFVLDQAAGYGALPPQRRYGVEVTMPPFTTRDWKETADGLLTLANALDLAAQKGWIPDDTAARLFSAAAGRMGIAAEGEEDGGGSK